MNVLFVYTLIPMFVTCFNCTSFTNGNIAYDW